MDGWGGMSEGKVVIVRSWRGVGDKCGVEWYFSFQSLFRLWMGYTRWVHNSSSLVLGKIQGLPLPNKVVQIAYIALVFTMQVLR